MLIPLNAQTKGSQLPYVTFSAPEVVGDNIFVSSDGTVDLVWSAEPADPELSYELQSSDNSRFTDAITRYSGLDSGSFISGLAGKSYFFRVRAIDNETAGPWSETLEVEVNYVDRGQVKTLMFIGTFCFIATVVIIVGGSLRAPKIERSSP